MDGALHNFTSKQKLVWWDDGEWANEPDEYQFEHMGIKCIVKRTAAFESNYINCFGGHLCGYIQIPENHPWYNANPFEIECNIHGGITYGQMEEDGYWIGFDCAHYNDICPSVEKMRKQSRLFLDLTYLKDALHNAVYKNFAYVTMECISLAEQALQVKNPESL